MKNSIQLLSLYILLAITPNFLQAVEVGDSAPCVVLDQIIPNESDMTGCIREPFSNDQDYTILEFSSIFCGDCHKSLPYLSELAEDVNHRATTRMVTIDRNEKMVRRYVSRNRELINFPVALDSMRDAKQSYSVVRTPTYFVLDRNQTILYRKAGPLTNKDVEAIKDIVLK